MALLKSGAFGLTPSEIKRMNKIIARPRQQKIRRGSTGGQLFGMNKVIANFIKNQRSPKP